MLSNSRMVDVDQSGCMGYVVSSEIAVVVGECVGCVECVVRDRDGCPVYMAYHYGVCCQRPG